MKRFYASATVGADGTIHLDGRPVHTPGRRLLAIPAPALARAIREEWERQGERIDPRSMPMTGLANAAIDRIAPDAPAFAAGLARYGESDLLCYRAETPEGLVRSQARAWDPVLDWARRRYDVDFEIVTGIIHRAQPASSVDRLAKAVAARGPFELAGLSPLVTVSGSLILSLAVAEGGIEPDEAWSAATVDEEWQARHWGEDEEAAAALAARRRDFDAGWRFLRLLEGPARPA